jgi:hypothetical protein
MISHYPAPAFDALTYFGMIGLTLLVVPIAALVFSAGFARRFWLWMLGCGAMMIATGVLSHLGVLSRTGTTPPMLPVVFIPIQVMLVLMWWRNRADPAKLPSMKQLVLLQSFRLPLESLMLHAALVGIMPVEFSMGGYNFDVVTGVLGLAFGVALYARLPLPRLVLIVWNIWGIGCLAAILVLAVLTAPNIAFFGDQPQHLSYWVLQFPYIWLPTILVSIAIYSHLCLSSLLHSSASGRVAETSRQPSSFQGSGYEN